MIDKDALPPQEYALLVQLPGDAHTVVERYLRMLLTYQYGLRIISAHSLQDAARRIDLQGPQIRSLFLLHSGDIDEEALRYLLKRRAIPSFCVLNHCHLSLFKPALKGIPHAHLCSAEQALSRQETSLRSLVTSIFAEWEIEDLLGPEDLPPSQLPERVQKRLGKLHTLPTLPEVALRIMRLIEDPATTMEDLEEFLLRDPAIVLKLSQMLTTPPFASTVQRGEWTLRETLVRLGLKKVGIVAQQIELMTRLAKPKESDFDLERFWKHSLACALIANRLCANGKFFRRKAPDFTTYWMSALLHDIGKLVLGFFFPQRYADIAGYLQKTPNISFREAENILGDVADHAYMGRLMLLKSGVAAELVDTVAAHHAPGDEPTNLTCLIHLANQFSKEAGFGFFADERGRYNAAVLKHLNLSQKRLQALGAQTIKGLDTEVNALFDLCRSAG